MNADDLIKKSYDFAADLAKQMITLSTAIITLCVAFTGKLFTSESASANSAWLFSALIVFVISIAFGIFALMGLTGQLAKTAESPTAPSDAQAAEGNGPKPSGQTNQDCQTPSLGIYNSTNRITSIVQVFLFIVGLALAITYVYKASTISVEPQPKIKTNGNELRIIRQSTFTVQDSVRIDTLVVS